ncbi:hypothetical protein E4U58_006658 [Claviceps cyperi]|nr:hypothetical protein E4U58_006658 [Claviceps cyperi]
MPPIPNLPRITPHGSKKCNKCLATKTLDHFTDLRRAFGVIRITVECDTAVPDTLPDVRRPDVTAMVTVYRFVTPASGDTLESQQTVV